MSTSPSKPGYIDIRDGRTQKLVCRYNPATREVEVMHRGELRRGALPDGQQRAEQEKK